MKSSISIQASSSHSNCAVEFRIIDRSARHPVHLVKMLMIRTKRKIQSISEFFFKDLGLPGFSSLWHSFSTWNHEILETYVKFIGWSLKPFKTLPLMQLKRFLQQTNKQFIYLPSSSTSVSANQKLLLVFPFWKWNSSSVSAIDYILTFTHE